MSNPALTQIYTVLQSLTSSGSGRGISFWRMAAECGRKARLMEQHKMDVSAEEGEEAESSTKPVGRIVGTHFHSLQQYWHEGRLPDNLALGADQTDIHFREAVRCFGVHRRFRPKGFYGVTVGCEVKLPRALDEATYLKEVFGDDFTLRADMIVRLSADDVSRIELQHGVTLGAPGLYLIDWKCLWQIDKKTPWEYQYGPQSLSYPLAYNLLHEKFPDRYPEPVQGMIFDVMARQTQKEENFKEHHFQIFVAQPLPDDIEVVRASIAAGQLNFEKDVANPHACIGKYDVCPFLKSGVCSRR